MPTTPSSDTATLSQTDAEPSDIKELDSFEDEESRFFVGDSETRLREEFGDDSLSQSAEDHFESQLDELAQDQDHADQLPDNDAINKSKQSTSESITTEDVIHEKEVEKRQPPPVDDLDELLGIASKDSAGKNTQSEKDSPEKEHQANSRNGKPETKKIERVRPQEKTVVDVRIQGMLAARVAIYWMLGVCYFVGFLFFSQVLTYPEIPFARHMRHFLSDAIHWGPVLILLTPLVIFDLMRTSQRILQPVIEVRDQLRNMLEGKEVCEVTTQESGCIGELVTAFEQLRQSEATDFLASAARRHEADALLESMDGSFSKTNFDDALIA